MTPTLPIVEELFPPPDPVAACERLAPLPHRLFLDSAAVSERSGRYSFLTADPSLVLRGRGQTTEEIGPGGQVRTLRGHALTNARQLLARYAAPHVAELPPFQGGLAGYIGYEFGGVLERVPSPRSDDLALPNAMLALYDWVVAWDHRQGRAWIISTGIPEQGDARRARAAGQLAVVAGHLASPSSLVANPEPLRARPRSIESVPAYPVDEAPASLAEGLRSSFSRSAYLDAVARVREYIVAGDIFQANISQRLQAPRREHPWELYRRLRRLDPAPFAGYLELGDFAIASASPERFLRVDAQRHVETRPIKGTRPRGGDPAHDASLAHALLTSDKDRAENLMIVDLLRNDISRACRPGSVRASELFALEYYSTVQHLVSTVTGVLADGADAVDLLCAAFPGGSITGAPKVRAMEIIAEIEPCARGVYSGSIGYLSVTGTMDSSIVIRTCLAVGDTLYLPVGGGIVADSDPEDEYEETLHKARGLVEALRP
ncbi:MAG: aminodeoxychorismate synthase component I [Gemmatimonadaceae bacterium]